MAVQQGEKGPPPMTLTRLQLGPLMWYFLGLDRFGVLASRGPR
jgi:hypothetical protein